MEEDNLTFEQRVKRADAIMQREMKRWVVRRWMAITAFGTLIALVMFLIVVAPLVLNGDQMGAISSNEPIIKFILGCLTTLVLGYYGLSSIDDVKSKAMQAVKALMK